MSLKIYLIIEPKNCTFSPHSLPQIYYKNIFKLEGGLQSMLLQMVINNFNIYSSRSIALRVSKKSEVIYE